MKKSNSIRYEANCQKIDHLLVSLSCDERRQAQKQCQKMRRDRIVIAVEEEKQEDVKMMDTKPQVLIANDEIF